MLFTISVVVVDAVVFALLAYGVVILIVIVVVGF